MPTWSRRVVAGVFIAATIHVLSAAPAAADPATPTNNRSEVVEVSPATPAIDVSVVGGDSFFLLEVDDGHEVAVPGYSGEPYLRVRADGTVQENQRSAAAFLNDSRNSTDPGRAFDPDEPPRWKTVASDGRWAWHDHRIHNMAATAPADARTSSGHPWRVPMVVDGREVVVTGRYRVLEPPSPWPWLVLAGAVGALVVVGARLLTPPTAAGTALLIAGTGGIVAGMAQRAASPPGASASVLLVVLPAVASVAGVIVVMQRGPILRATVALAGAAAAGGWALLRLSVLWKAVVPTDLSAPTDRALTTVALGAAAGAALVVVRSGALAPPRLVPDEDAGAEPV